MQISNWINKINSKNPYSNRVKPTEGIKYKKRKKYDLVGIATRVKNQILYVWASSISNVQQI